MLRENQRGTLIVHLKTQCVKWPRREIIPEMDRVGSLRGPRRTEAHPFGQANVVALGPEIALTRLPWPSVTVFLHIFGLTSESVPTCLS